MTTTLLTGIALTLAATASVASAQPAPTGGWNAPGGMAQPATRADVAAHVRTMFASLDLNRDGALTQAEVRNGASAMRGAQMRGGRGARGQVDPAQRAARRGQASDRFDRDRNGVITRDEFASGEGRRAQRMPGGMAMNGGMMAGGMMTGGMGGRMFAMADVNRDGRVTLTEATVTALRHFDMVDRNRDGRITPDERQMMRRQMLGQMRG